MDLFLAICQGLGLALAIGIGGALAALFVSAMASLDSGINAEGTDYDFIEATWFLVLLLALVAITIYARGRDFARYPLIAVLSAAGALAAAASLAEEGETAWPGLLLGAIVAGCAAIVAIAVLDGAISRAKGAGTQEADDAVNTLVIAFALAGIVVAALALFVPPVSLIVAVALLALAAGRRRKAGEKYEGLRILR